MIMDGTILNLQLAHLLLPVAARQVGLIAHVQGCVLAGSFVSRGGRKPGHQQLARVAQVASERVDVDYLVI